MKQPDDWDPDERDAVTDLQEELNAMRARHAGDPPLALLRAARGEALPEPLQARIIQHLSESAWSRTLVEGADAAEVSLTPSEEQQILDRVQSQNAGASSPLRWNRFWIPALAAVGAAVLLVVVFGRIDRAVPSIEPPAATATAPAVPAPAVPSPSFAVALSKPDIKLNPAAFAFRGVENEKQFFADLKRALDAFRESDYARADREFAGLAPRYPKSVEVAFYQGVSRIYLNDLEGADRSLAAAEQLNDASFGFEVMWYRAIVDGRAGRTASARTRLDTLCRDGSFVRQAQACESARQLR